MLETPTQFYDALLCGVRSARKRVVLASLYIGSGSREVHVHVGHVCTLRFHTLNSRFLVCAISKRVPGEVHVDHVHVFDLSTVRARESVVHLGTVRPFQMTQLYIDHNCL